MPAPVATVRTELLRALRGLGAELDASGVAVLTAHRGGAWSAATLHPEKVPWDVRIDLADASGGCAVTVAFTARWPSSAPFPASAAGAYGQAFTAACAGLDAALRRLAPGVAFARPTLVGATGGVAPPAAVRSGANAAAKIGRLLEGKAAPTQLSGDVVLVCGTRVAAFDLQTLFLMTTVGVGVVARPGGMPPGLVAQVADLTARLDARLATADPARGTVRVEIAAGDVPVVEFLHLQAWLRTTLPLRTLQVCTACRLEKIVNPDYQRLQARNRRKNLLTGSLGGAVSTHGVSPFLVVGRLLQLKNAGADEFVCPRCQGLDADETIVTFCPECGDRRAESALRACPKCAHDFRRDVPGVALWSEVDAPTPLPAPVAVPPLPTPVAGPPAAVSEGPPAAVSGGPPPYVAEVVRPVVTRSDGWSAPVSHAYEQTPTNKGFLGRFGGATRTEPAATVTAPSVESPATPNHAAGWYADPDGAPVWRWWDGSAWTEHVSSGS